MASLRLSASSLIFDWRFHSQGKRRRGAAGSTWESNQVKLDFYTSNEGEPKVSTKTTGSFTQFLGPAAGRSAAITADGAPAPEGDDDMP